MSFRPRTSTHLTRDDSTLFYGYTFADFYGYPTAEFYGYPISEPFGKYPVGDEVAFYRAAYLSQCGRQRTPDWDGPSIGRPLKVIHVSTHMLQAGIDQWLGALMRFSNPNKIQFTRFVVTSDFVDSQQLASIGVPIEVGGRESVRRACVDADIVLVSDPGDNADWFLDVRPKLCVFVAHGDGAWTALRLNQLSPAIDHVVAVSKSVQQRVCNGHPTSVILNGVNAARLAATRDRNEFRESLGFGPNDFVIGYVGRFSGEKRPAAVLQATRRLPHRFKALMVGFGHLRAELLDEANETLPGRYAFIRACEEIGNCYAAMDALCLVSESEGYGLVIMEAMMTGTPVIVTPVGFVPEVIQNRVNGIIVNGEPASIAEAALLLDQHPDWARAVAMEGQAYAQQHGHASRMASEYEQLLQRLWQERNPL